MKQQRRTSLANPSPLCNFCVSFSVVNYLSCFEYTLTFFLSSRLHNPTASYTVPFGPKYQSRVHCSRLGQHACSCESRKNTGCTVIGRTAASAKLPSQHPTVFLSCVTPCIVIMHAETCLIVTVSHRGHPRTHLRAHRLNLAPLWCCLPASAPRTTCPTSVNPYVYFSYFFLLFLTFLHKSRKSNPLYFFFYLPGL